MVRTVPHRPASHAGIFGKIKQHLVLKHESEVLKTRAESLRDDIMAFLETNGEVDEKGSLSLELPDVISIAGKEFRSVKRERRVSTRFDEDAAETLLLTKGLLSFAQRSVVTIHSSMIRGDDFSVTESGDVTSGAPTYVVEDAVVDWSTTIDQNEVYVLNQQGKISNDELDSLFVETISWAYRQTAA